MNTARIILAGLGPKLDGLRWEAEQSLRIGRQATADVVLHDFSVERLHAEVKNGGSRWIVRDLAASVHYPTLVNGVVLIGSHQELREQDILQLGKLKIKVATLINAPLDGELPDARPLPAPTRVLPAAPGPGPTDPHPSGLLARRRLPTAAGLSAPSNGNLVTSFGELHVQAVTQHTWDQALEWIALDRKPQQGHAMLTLLRANHHLCNLANLDELLESILADTLAALGAQRGAILLGDPGAEQLTLKACLSPLLKSSNKGYSKTLIERCFAKGESFLCQDVQADQTLAGARSVKVGAMSSVICALLRTPRKRLGVLHLDRGPLQDPFTENELYLADAIAANVAIGIECAQVVDEQRQQFIQTVTTLARAVEMRDQYTGDHTQRVTDYALLLADELRVPQLARYQLQIGTPLHDIGKIGIDDAILRKPGRLTPAEFDAMKTHTVKGAAMLEGIGSLNPVIPIVRHHHERWDGSGYPDRIGRDQIALTARIVAVADAFDAMTSHRPYRPAMPPQLAYLELLSKAGTHFDPACVQAFLRVRPKVDELIQQC